MEKPNTLLFSLPDFYSLFGLNITLLNMMHENPEFFEDDVKVDSVYGSFPGCIWNSGRAYMGQSDFENIVNTVAPFNQLGVSVRFTFTNALLTGRHLMDYYCNTILGICEKLIPGMKNGVNVNVPILADHIQKSFPEYYLLWSTTKDISSVQQINDLSSDRLTVLYYGMNNTDVLDQLDRPENIEILVNEACIENCPTRQAHYKSISQLQLITPSEGFTCPHGCEQYYYYETVPKRAHYVSPQMMRDIYLPRGINKFKISGRHDNPINVIENYVNYLAKPEYRDHVRNCLLIAWYTPGNAQSIAEFKQAQAEKAAKAQNIANNIKKK